MGIYIILKMNRGAFLNKTKYNPEEGSASGWPLVLYFHHIHPHLDHYTSITPKEFELAMTLVKKSFTFMDPNLLSNRNYDWIPNEPSVVITFDDGYKDNITYALPILEKLSIKAIFFVSIDHIGKNNLDSNPKECYLSLEDLKIIKSKGHCIGAHTMSHSALHTLSFNDAEKEIFDSIEYIKRLFTIENVHFAYPYGFLPSKKIQLPFETLGFGTVKATSIEWYKEKDNIRRTYLPTGKTEIWEYLIEGWWNQWFK